MYLIIEIIIIMYYEIKKKKKRRIFRKNDMRENELNVLRFFYTMCNEHQGID